MKTLGLRDYLATIVLLVLSTSPFPSTAQSDDAVGPNGDEIELSFLAPLAVVGIMAEAGGKPSTIARRDAAWDAWADLAANAPHLVGHVKCAFVVGWTAREAQAEQGFKGQETDELAGPASTNQRWEATYSETDAATDFSGRAGLPVLTVPVVDSYQAVVVKVLVLYRWALQHTTCRFVIKADDDTFLRVPLLVSSVLQTSDSAASTIEGLYYGQFCTGAPTRLAGHKNFVPEACYPLSSLPPYAHGGLYAVSRDVASFVSGNAKHFHKGTINNCIRRLCGGGGGGGAGNTNRSNSSSVSNDPELLPAKTGGEGSSASTVPGWCANNRGQLPSLEDVQMALWVLPLSLSSSSSTTTPHGLGSASSGVGASNGGVGGLGGVVHDHRLVGAASCHSNAVAVWDVPPAVMRDMGEALRRSKRDAAGGEAAAGGGGSASPSSPSPSSSSSSPCVPSLMAHALGAFEAKSLRSAFHNGGHRFPINHQVYHLYYTHFLHLVRAGQWARALKAWTSNATALAPHAPHASELKPLADYLARQLAQDGCLQCALDLSPLLESLNAEQGRGVGVCSSTSGNVDSLDHSLTTLVAHIRSPFA